MSIKRNMVTLFLFSAALYLYAVQDLHFNEILEESLENVAEGIDSVATSPGYSAEAEEIPEIFSGLKTDVHRNSIYIDNKTEAIGSNDFFKVASTAVSDLSLKDESIPMSAGVGAPKAALCVTTVKMGKTRHAGSVQKSPLQPNVSFFFHDGEEVESIKNKGWTPVLLNTSIIPFDTTGGPSEFPSLGWTEDDIANLQAKYVKILSHMIPEFRGCELVMYADSKVVLRREQLDEAVTGFHRIAATRPNGLCVVLTRHNHKSPSPDNVLHDEIRFSYIQPRYARFRPSIDKQLDFHRRANHSLSGTMHMGGVHIWNLSHPDAARLQRAWWNETLAYSIQDQLSQFFALQPFRHCYTSWADMDGRTFNTVKVKWARAPRQAKARRRRRRDSDRTTRTATRLPAS